MTKYLDICHRFKSRGFGNHNPGLVPGWLVPARGPEKKKTNPSINITLYIILKVVMTI